MNNTINYSDVKDYEMHEWCKFAENRQYFSRMCKKCLKKHWMGNADHYGFDISQGIKARVNTSLSNR